MIAQTLNMCTRYFVLIWYMFSYFWRVLNLDIFSIRNDLWVPSFLICNCNSFQSFIF